MANPKNDISTKGLDQFAKQFLLKNSPPGEEEYIKVSDGQQLKPEAVKRYEQERLADFIKRAGHFTEDVVAFIVEQKNLRNLSDIETVFGVALATINLRNSYGSQPDEESSDAQKEAHLKEFDDICAHAQEFFDANT